MPDERRRPRRLAIRLAYVVFLVVLLELGSRTYWKLHDGVPFWSTDRILYTFYPELVLLRDGHETTGDEQFDVLLLGGSVLHREYGDIPERLARELGSLVEQPVAIHNLAGSGHTTLDSLRKYASVSDHAFDLVLVYHGVNEVRANNCPPEVFRDDYTHYAYYDLIDRLERHRLIGLVSFPYTFEYVWTRVLQKLDWIEYVPQNSPRADWMEHGADLKTAAPFERNLETIVNMATARGEPIVLMTFASHLPQGYSRPLFAQKVLDYGAHLLPAEIWGRADLVVAGIRGHNQAVVRVSERTGAPFVDQAGGIPGDGEHFDDVCHLSPAGCQRFVENLLPAVGERIGAGD